MQVTTEKEELKIHNILLGTVIVIFIGHSCVKRGRISITNFVFLNKMYKKENPWEIPCLYF